VNFVEMNALPPGEVGVYPEFHHDLDGVVQWLYHELNKFNFKVRQKGLVHTARSES
jgi:hypothetical protein